MNKLPEALRLADDLYSNDQLGLLSRASSELRRQHALIQEMREVLNEVNSWICCAAITTPEDMAQNFHHIQTVVDSVLIKGEILT